MTNPLPLVSGCHENTGNAFRIHSFICQNLPAYLINICLRNKQYPHHRIKLVQILRIYKSMGLQISLQLDYHHLESLNSNKQFIFTRSLFIISNRYPFCKPAKNICSFLLCDLFLYNQRMIRIHRSLAHILNRLHSDGFAKHIASYSSMSYFSPGTLVIQYPSIVSFYSHQGNIS